VHAIVGFTLVPLGSGVSVSPYIAAIERVLEASDLNFEVNLQRHQHRRRLG